MQYKHVTLNLVSTHVLQSTYMSDQWLNDCLVTYIEDVLRTISNDVILAHFQQMENRVFFL